MMVVNLLKSSVGNDKLEQLHQSVQNSYLFCTKKHIFSILHIYFYKTPTSIYLFYNLFYLNNHFLTFFIILSQTLSLHSQDSLYSHMKIQSKHGGKNFDPSTVRNSSLKLRSKHRYSPIHKRWFASANSFFVSLLVCLVLWCLWLILWLIFYFCGWFVSVGVCVLEEEEDDEGQKMCWFCRWRRERKKRSKIRNY